MKDISKALVYAGVFAIPFIPLIIANSMFFPFITGKNFTFRIVVETVFAFWVILALYEPQYRPKLSWILGGFATFILVMFAANSLGEYPLKSFWSNFERMDGYVTLVHLFLYFLVLGSVLTTDKLWNRFFNTTLFAASVLAFYAFAQLSGQIDIRQGGWRLDGTLGNSTYMAIYTLFHIAIAALMIVRTKSKNARWVYLALIAVFVFLLIQTATRGTILGLVGGSFVGAAYVALFAKNHPAVRRVSAWALLGVVLIVAGFIAAKDTAPIQNNPYLSRVANISIERDGAARFEIWSMAFEGVKERPLLGWGQGNYNYVFNKYYRPELYGEEQWFDRVHNIVLDWLIAGGVVGTVAYFFVFFSAVYYLFVVPLIRKDDEAFTVAERGILLGLLAGYLFHNLFVFDNIVSYIYYATILAFIHSKRGVLFPAIQNVAVNRRIVEQVAVPVVVVALAGAVYMVNVPNILAARDIIDAFRAQDAETSIEAFKRALSRNSFADQEIREQLTRQTQSIIRAEGLPSEFKQETFKFTENELLEQIKEKPGDARVHVFISSFYRFTQNYEPATEQLAIARSLSPNKQQIIFEQGLVELQKQNTAEALAFFKEAYELAPEYSLARTFYAAAALFDGQRELAHSLLEEERDLKQFALNDLAVNAAYNAQDYELLKEVFRVRIEENPSDRQARVNLAVAYHETGDTAAAIEVLRKAGEDIPEFKEQAEGFMEDLAAGRLPGAQPEVTVEGDTVESRTISQ